MTSVAGRLPLSRARHAAGTGTVSPLVTARTGDSGPSRWPGMTSRGRDCYRRLRDTHERVPGWAHGPWPPVDRITHLLALPDVRPPGGTAVEDVLTHHDEGKAE
ncbi:hypothetical protein Plo01_11950 [Planobispora longispora]|uniref:Uncharacterized protein n=1 Tax=Planobispora longispora TaxID=28887 RepID=A0A8J3RID7_9ACTN|nr:hypothetical protein Plo01_11950 [Planobispora longispora]